MMMMMPNLRGRVSLLDSLGGEDSYSSRKGTTAASRSSGSSNSETMASCREGTHTTAHIFSAVGIDKITKKS